MREADGYRVRVYRAHHGYMDWMWNWEVAEVWEEPVGGGVGQISLADSGACFTRWGARRAARRQIATKFKPDEVDLDEVFRR